MRLHYAWVVAGGDLSRLAGLGRHRRHARRARPAARARIRLGPRHGLAGAVDQPVAVRPVRTIRWRADGALRRAAGHARALIDPGRGGRLEHVHAGVLAAHRCCGACSSAWARARWRWCSARPSRRAGSFGGAGWSPGSSPPAPPPGSSIFLPLQAAIVETLAGGQRCCWSCWGRRRRGRAGGAVHARRPAPGRAASRTAPTTRAVPAAVSRCRGRAIRSRWPSRRSCRRARVRDFWLLAGSFADLRRDDRRPDRRCT